VFANAWADEGEDRVSLELSANGSYLIGFTAGFCKNTVAILHIPGPTIVEEFADNENVTAILAPFFPGEQSGNSLVSVLYGDVSPSGKLPFTMGKDPSDWPENTIVKDPIFAPQADFTEKLLIDYRWFDSKNITPRYEFGFGLSYSTFSYSNIKLSHSFQADSTSIQKTNEKFEGQKKGESIYDTVATVTAQIKNTGKVTASEVAQLYLQFPSSESQPPRLLRGFEKLKNLSPGASATASFPLRRKDLMVWDVVKQVWRAPKGESTLHVGSSSRKLPLSVKYSSK